MLYWIPLGIVMNAVRGQKVGYDNSPPRFTENGTSRYLMKILVIHGPNLNMLGKRDPTKYGTLTIADINKRMQIIASELNYKIEFFQSNHEGAIIDYLQLEASRAADGVI